MKICPACSQTYQDESLNFCLSDGAVLSTVSDERNSQPTVVMSPSAVTDQQRQVAGPTSANATAPQFSPVFSQNAPVNRAPKKSKAWVWVLGIVGILLVFGGETIRGFIFCMFLGVIVGTYSSLFIAAPIVVDAMQRRLENEGESMKVVPVVEK